MKNLKGLILGRLARKGSKASKETIEKLRKSHLGKSVSKETRRKMSIAHKGSLHTKLGGINGAKKRWVSHVKKVRKVRKLLITHDKEIQLQKKRFRNQRYKARKKNSLGSHTFEEWQLLKIYYRNMCLCCKKREPEIKLTEDHIIPLSMGGTDYIDNIQPLCVGCNTRKMTKAISYINNFNSEGGEHRVFLN